MLENRRIAVIDDDEGARTSIVAFLRSLGCSACAYPSADAYLADTAARWECVISDIEMPGLDGFQLLSVLRRRAGNVPVILLTGLPIPNGRQRALDAGAACLLEKPIDDEILVSCLADIVDG